jgi:hypothetical protein
MTQAKSTGMDGIDNVGEAGDHSGRPHGDRDEVDPPEEIGEFRPFRQKELRPAQQPSGLSRGQRLLGGDKSLTVASLHLDEHEHVAVAHDEIELAIRASPVCRHEPVSPLFQMTACQLLAGCSQRLTGGLRHTPGSQPATGEKHRRW